MLFRSFLFCPGNHARRVEKALSLGADAVILDLEDAVAISEKVATRSVAVQALQQPRRCRGYIRVNAMSTEFCYGDLVAVVRPGVDGIVLPKVEAATCLQTADWVVSQLERERGLKPGSIDIIPIIETGKGMAQISAIAAAGTRVRRLAFGAGDFTLDMNVTWTRDESELLAYRAAIVMASRAADLEPPIDTVWTDLGDLDGFRSSAMRGRGNGFQGKLCIHPDQVPIVNAAFSPTEVEVAQARRIVDAFRDAEARGLASIQLEGQFIDYPIVYRAQRVLDAAERTQEPSLGCRVSPETL
jgi:citrate lyase subunit beta / citryl-CoA lyase